jgi:hypothetical protein
LTDLKYPPKSKCLHLEVISEPVDPFSKSPPNAEGWTLGLIEEGWLAGSISDQERELAGLKSPPEREGSILKWLKEVVAGRLVYLWTSFRCLRNRFEVELKEMLADLNYSPESECSHLECLREGMAERLIHSKCQTIPLPAVMKNGWQT